jgi:D-alanine-D-alanine ligase
MERPHVIVLMGGPDAEREVSLMSGREVASALRRSGRFRVTDLVIDRPDVEDLRSMGGDVVFPVLHGPWGEGGPLQALLERSGVPYVGSGPAAAALAMDKMTTKSLAAAAGIPTPPAQTITAGQLCAIAPPLVLKPVDDGSSVDLAICRSEGEVSAARRRLHARRSRLMAERYVAGRELTVGIVNGRALPVIEIRPAEGVYDYQAKYHRDDTGYVIDPELPHGCPVQRYALEANRILSCRDLARVDFILDRDGPWLLEVNTMPGFTSHSLVPMAARSIGIEMPELCSSLVGAALSRAAPVGRGP